MPLLEYIKELAPIGGMIIGSNALTAYITTRSSRKKSDADAESAEANAEQTRTNISMGLLKDVQAQYKETLKGLRACEERALKFHDKLEELTKENSDIKIDNANMRSAIGDMRGKIEALERQLQRQDATNVKQAEINVEHANMKVEKAS